MSMQFSYTCNVSDSFSNAKYFIIFSDTKYPIILYM